MFNNKCNRCFCSPCVCQSSAKCKKCKQLLVNCTCNWKSTINPSSLQRDNSKDVVFLLDDKWINGKITKFQGDNILVECPNGTNQISMKDKYCLYISKECDFQDKQGLWASGKINDIDFGNKKIYIHFHNFPPQYDEWISFLKEHDRIAPFNSKTQDGNNIFNKNDTALIKLSEQNQIPAKVLNTSGNQVYLFFDNQKHWFHLKDYNIIKIDDGFYSFFFSDVLDNLKTPGEFQLDQPVEVLIKNKWQPGQVVDAKGDMVQVLFGEPFQVVPINLKEQSRYIRRRKSFINLPEVQPNIPENLPKPVESSPFKQKEDNIVPSLFENYEDAPNIEPNLKPFPMSIGDMLDVSDRVGRWYEAEIIQINGHEFTVKFPHPYDDPRYNETYHWCHHAHKLAELHSFSSIPSSGRYSPSQQVWILYPESSNEYFLSDVLKVYGGQIQVVIPLKDGAHKRWFHENSGFIFPYNQKPDWPPPCPHIAFDQDVKLYHDKMIEVIHQASKKWRPATVFMVGSSFRRFIRVVYEPDPSEKTPILDTFALPEYREYIRELGINIPLSQIEIEKEKKMIAFEEKLFSVRGFKMVTVKNDGQCFYRAISHQLFNDEEKHLNVRKACHNHMRQYKEYFLGFFKDEKEFEERLNSSDSWGDEYEICAVREFYNRPIEILYLNKDLKPLTEEEKKTPTLRILYTGNHYNSIVDPSNPPPIGKGTEEYNQFIENRMRNVVEIKQLTNAEIRMAWNIVAGPQDSVNIDLLESILVFILDSLFQKLRSLLQRANQMEDMKRLTSYYQKISEEIPSLKDRFLKEYLPSSVQSSNNLSFSDFIASYHKAKFTLFNLGSVV